MKVRDLMTRDVTTIGRNDTLAVAEELMKTRRFRHLPVVEEKRLVGMLSERDLFHAALSTALNFGQKAQQEFLKTILVKEVMTDEVVSIGPEAEVKDAARLMLDRRIGSLPVLEGAKLVGILSETDLLKVIAG
jgi:CBS domain-containing protein